MREAELFQKERIEIVDFDDLRCSGDPGDIC